MEEECNNNNDPELKKWMLIIEKRLGRLEGEMKVVLLMLSAIMGVLIAVLTKT
ncbi:MAG: hypothetical protein NDF57_05140 [archaeon GBS-70-058]|nr:hypothetical protein [Candidatus Culexarchaeum nevadense]